uniref:HTH CENPB-type domain-containing protein n=1 Tax=Pelodiscus sinensis TaxID=13735 RepID=K7FHP3_PELSI
KRKHVTLTLNQKLEIIKMLEREHYHESINIGSSTTYDIKKQKDRLRVFVAKIFVAKHTEVRQSLIRPKMAQLDVALFKWFSAKHSEVKPITGPVLIEKAKRFHSEMNISESCVFRGWWRNFKYWHGICKLGISGEQKSADHVATEEYSTVFEQLVEEHGLSASQIVCRTLLWLLVVKGLLMASKANVSGTHKLKLFVVGKCKKPRAFKIRMSLPVIYEAQGNAWMMAEILKDCFFNYFVPVVKENFRKGGVYWRIVKAVLLLDNCEAHPPASELVSGNIFATYLPENVTSLIQPMDQGMIQNFKCFYRGSFVRKLVNSDSSVSEVQFDFNLKDSVYVAALAWKDVKRATVRKCWRKLWPSIMFCDDSSYEEEFCGFHVRCKRIGDIQEMIENVPEKNAIAKLTENEIEQCLDMDKDEPVVESLSDAAIIESVIKPQKPQEEEEEVTERAKYTWREATDFISKSVEFAESCSQYNAAEVMNLRGIKVIQNNKKSQSSKQADLR